MRGSTILVAALGWTLVVAGVARAADADNPNHAAYVKYCGACHGPNGKGDGIIAPLMTPKPTNLTLLAKQHGGEFDAMAVYKSVSGAGMPKAHGDSEMPVWGEELRHEVGGGDPRTAEVTLVKIVNYLRSIQQK
ncbi:cytochrome c [Candidatus Binatia bacterium]|jgi:mono/diheme cytochrome c family protein|nr:cytochrome c [Candidatus Binatia bacterium]